MYFDCPICGSPAFAIKDGEEFRCVCDGGKQHTFPARIPAAPYCIAFSADADKPEGRTVTIGENTRLASYYFYSTPEQLLTAWLKDFSAGRDSAWYWIYAEGRCICSGTYDPDDISAFEEVFGVDFVVYVLNKCR